MKNDKEKPSHLLWTLAAVFVVLAIGDFAHAEWLDAIPDLALAGACSLGASGHALRPGVLNWVAYLLVAIAVVVIIAV